MTLWLIALTICMPLGPDSRDCARVYIHAESVGQVWAERSDCERVRPHAERATMLLLTASGWGAAWIDGSACEKVGQVM
jgi:hypothetical protein